jgi:hypothetical protein
MPFTFTAMRAAAAVLAFASVTAATPMPHIIETHLQGRTLQSPVSGLPGCSISDSGQSDNQDPTWAVGQSNYTDGEGYDVGNDCNGGSGADHCWTDYFIVGTEEAYNNWYEAIGDIQCSGNGSCSQSISQLQQQCTTTTWSVSTTITTDFEFEIAKIGLAVTLTGGQSYMSCSANTTTETCTWTDSGCHSVWAAQRLTTVYGYKRRSCNTPTNAPNANMPNTQQRSDGYYTRGMMDFAIPLATGNAITCNGTCASNYSPGVLPSIPGGNTLVPWNSNSS